LAIDHPSGDLLRIEVHENECAVGRISFSDAKREFTILEFQRGFVWIEYIEEYRPRHKEILTITAISIFEMMVTSFAPGINSEGNKTCEELMRVARIVTFTCARFSLAVTVFVPVGDIEVLSCPSTGYTTKRHPNKS